MVLRDVVLMIVIDFRPLFGTKIDAKSIFEPKIGKNEKLIVIMKKQVLKVKQLIQQTVHGKKSLKI